MSVEFDRGSPGKFDSRTLNRESLDRWTGRNNNDNDSIYIAGGPAPHADAMCLFMH